MTGRSVVVVASGADAQRRRFARDGEACWAAALHAVLEKHGYLDVELRTEDALADPGLFSVPRAVLVATLPPGAWTAEAAAAALRGPAQTFVEGPLPAALRECLGLADAPLPLVADGTLRIADAGLRRHAATFGATPGGAMSNGTGHPMELDPGLRWDAGAAVPIEPAQAEAWRRSGWEATDLGVPPEQADVLATFAPREGGREPRPAILRSGALTVAGIGLLSFVARAHTSEPQAAGEWRSWSRTLGVELALLALLDDLLARAGLTRVRVLPWRRHVRWALSVRHDVDRVPSLDDVADVLRRHARIGTRATWYWRARHLAAGPDGAAVLRRVAAARGHEVALHTEQLWNEAAGAELRAVGAALRQAPRGSCAHGEASCFRYQGAPNVLAAAAGGLDYTEMLQHAHMHPHRFVALSADGTVEPLDVICLPHHESFDTGTGPGQHQGELVLQRFEAYRRAGGLMQVLNHPDLHLDDVFGVLAQAPEDDRVDVTAIDAVRWWRRSHLTRELTIEPHGGGHRVRSRRGVSDLVLEARRPDGSTRRIAVNAPPGIWVEA